MNRARLLRFLTIALVLFYEGVPPGRAFLEWAREPWPRDPGQQVHAEFPAIREILGSLPEGVSEFSLSEELRNEPLLFQRFVNIGFPRRCLESAKVQIRREKGDYLVEIRN